MAHSESCKNTFTLNQKVNKKNVEYVFKTKIKIYMQMIALFPLKQKIEVRNNYFLKTRTVGRNKEKIEKKSVLKIKNSIRMKTIEENNTLKIDKWKERLKKKKILVSGLACSFG